jgi:putative membrane protein
MRASAVAALALGLALFVGIVAWQGVREVAAALSHAGWGLLAVAAYHLVPLVTDTFAWRTLFPRPRPALARMLGARWVCDAVNSLLPVPQVGGDVVRAHLLATRGVPGRLAGATVLVDLTLSALTQIVFTLIGVGLLLAHLGRHDVVPAILVPLGLFAMGLLAFYRLQRRGLFGLLARTLARVTGGSTLLGGAEALDRAVGAVYRRRGAVLRSAWWNLASWLLGTGETWLALRFLGRPVSVEEALLLESLGQAARNAAFVVPAGLGVQEGGYLVLGGLLGLPGDVSLALSLAKRTREVVLGVPGLVGWQAAEVVRRRRRAA